MGRSRPRISGPSGFELATSVRKVQAYTEPAIFVRQALDDESCRSGSLHFPSLASPESIGSDTKHAAQALRHFIQEAGVVAEDATVHLNQKPLWQKQRWNHNTEIKTRDGALSQRQLQPTWVTDDNSGGRKLVCDASSSDRSSTDQTIALLGPIGDASLPRRTAEVLQQSELTRVHYAALELMGKNGNPSLKQLVFNGNKIHRDSISEFSTTVLARLEPNQASRIRKLLYLYHLKDAQLKLLSTDLERQSRALSTLQQENPAGTVHQSLQQKLLGLAAERLGEELVADAAQLLAVDPEEVRKCLAGSSQAAFPDKLNNAVYKEHPVTDIVVVAEPRVVKPEASGRHKPTRVKSNSRSKSASPRSVRSGSVAAVFANEIDRLRREINALEASIAGMTPTTKRARKIKSSGRTTVFGKVHSADMALSGLPPQADRGASDVASTTSIVRWRSTVLPRRTAKLPSSQRPRRNAPVLWVQGRSPSCPAVVQPSLSAGATSATWRSCAGYGAEQPALTLVSKPEARPNGMPRNVSDSASQTIGRAQSRQGDLMHVPVARPRPSISQSSQSTVPLGNIAAARFASAADGDAETCARLRLSAIEPRMEAENHGARFSRNIRLPPSMPTLHQSIMQCSVCSADELTPVHGRSPLMTMPVPNPPARPVRPSPTASRPHCQCSPFFRTQAAISSTPSKLAWPNASSATASFCGDKVPEVKERPRPSSLLGAPDPSAPSPTLSLSRVSHGHTAPFQVMLNGPSAGPPLRSTVHLNRHAPSVLQSKMGFEQADVTSDHAMAQASMCATSSAVPCSGPFVANDEFTRQSPAIEAGAGQPPIESASITPVTMHQSRGIDHDATDEANSAFKLRSSANSTDSDSHRNPLPLTERLNDADTTRLDISDIGADPSTVLAFVNHAVSSTSSDARPNTDFHFGCRSRSPSLDNAFSSSSTVGLQPIMWPPDLPEVPPMVSDSSSESFTAALRGGAMAYWGQVVAPLTSVPLLATQASHLDHSSDSAAASPCQSSNEAATPSSIRGQLKHEIPLPQSSLAVKLALPEERMAGVDAGPTPIHGQAGASGREAAFGENVRYGTLTFTSDRLALLPQVLSISVGTLTDVESLEDSIRTSKSVATSAFHGNEERCSSQSPETMGYTARSVSHQEWEPMDVNELLPTPVIGNELQYGSSLRRVHETSFPVEGKQASLTSGHTISSEGERLVRHQSLYMASSLLSVNNGSLPLDAEALCPTGRSLDRPFCKRVGFARDRCSSAV